MLSLQVRVNFSNSNLWKTLKRNVVFEEETSYLKYFCNLHTEKVTDALSNLSKTEKVKALISEINQIIFANSPLKL